MRIIPTSVHGVLDYLVGVLLVAAPWIFGFNDVDSAKWTAILIGIIVLATSLMTNYELGLIRAIPMRMHLMSDALVGIVLVISPWIFGFRDEGTHAWLPMVVIGIGEIGAALMSETVSRRDDLARRERHMVGQGV